MLGHFPVGEFRWNYAPLPEELFDLSHAGAVPGIGETPAKTGMVLARGAVRGVLVGAAKFSRAGKAACPVPSEAVWKPHRCYDSLAESRGER